MKKKPTELFVFGFGGAFKEISNLILKNELYNIVVVLENNIYEITKSSNFRTIQEDLFFNSYEYKEVSVVVLIGDINVRKKIVTLIKAKLQFVVFPSLNFSKHLKSTSLNEGNLIMPGSVFTDEDINIGSFNYFNFNSFIAHDVQIGSFNTFSPYVKISGNCKILSNNFFGTGCILFPNIMVDNSNVGAGAVVKRKKLIKQIVNIPKCIIYDKR